MVRHPLHPLACIPGLNRVSRDSGPLMVRFLHVKVGIAVFLPRGNHARTDEEPALPRRTRDAFFLEYGMQPGQVEHRNGVY